MADDAKVDPAAMSAAAKEPVASEESAEAEDSSKEAEEIFSSPLPPAKTPTPDDAPLTSAPHSATEHVPSTTTADVKSDTTTSSEAVTVEKSESPKPASDVKIEEAVKKDSDEEKNDVPEQDDDDEYEDLSTEEYESLDHGHDSADEEDDVEEDEEDAAEEVREQGDGEESADAAQPDKPLDDDEDKRNPQYIPKRGAFYEHDDRLGPEEIAAAEEAERKEAEEAKEEGEEKTVVEPVEGVPEVLSLDVDAPRKASSTDAEPGKKSKKLWVDDGKWGHDMFKEDDQKPKSKDELVVLYGYDIRNEDSAPKARRRRRYGRGPNKYTRNWQDEEAYGAGERRKSTNDSKEKIDGSEQGDEDRDVPEKEELKVTEKPAPREKRNYDRDDDFKPRERRDRGERRTYRDDRPEKSDRFPKNDRPPRKSNSPSRNRDFNNKEEDFPTLSDNKAPVPRHERKRYDRDDNKQGGSVWNKPKENRERRDYHNDRNDGDKRSSYHRGGDDRQDDREAAPMRSLTFENSRRREFRDKRDKPDRGPREDRFNDQPPRNGTSYQDKIKMRDENLQQNAGRPIVKAGSLNPDAPDRGPRHDNRDRGGKTSRGRRSDVVGTGRVRGNAQYNDEERDYQQDDRQPNKSNVQRGDDRNQQQRTSKRYSSLRQQAQRTAAGEVLPGGGVPSDLTQALPALQTPQYYDASSPHSPSYYAAPVPDEHHSPQGSFAYLAGGAEGSPGGYIQPTRFIAPAGSGQPPPGMPPAVAPAFLPTYPPSGYPQYPPPQYIPSAVPDLLPPAGALQPPGPEVFRGGVTYYDPSTQQPPRSLPPKRPKNIIPIVPPPDLGAMGGGIDRGDGLDVN